MNCDTQKRWMGGGGGEKEEQERKEYEIRGKKKIKWTGIRF